MYGWKMYKVYPQTHVSSSSVWLKALDAGLSQNACGEQTKNIL